MRARSLRVMLPALAAGLAIVALEHESILRGAVEGGLSVLAVLAVENAAAAREHLAPLFATRARGRAIALLGAAVLVAQVIARPRLTYPLVCWVMYGTPIPQGPSVFYRYVGIGADGRERALSPARAYPLLDQFRLAYRLQELDDLAAKPEGAEYAKTLDRAVLAMAGREGTFARVRIDRCTAEVTRLEADPVCTPYRTVEAR